MQGTNARAAGYLVITPTFLHDTNLVITQPSYHPT